MVFYTLQCQENTSFFMNSPWWVLCCDASHQCDFDTIMILVSRLKSSVSCFAAPGGVLKFFIIYYYKIRKVMLTLLHFTYLLELFFLSFMIAYLKWIKACFKWVAYLKQGFGPGTFLWSWGWIFFLLNI